MLSYVARTSNLSHTTKATTQAVASAVKPIIPGVSVASDKFVVQPPVQKFTKDSLAASLPTQALRASASIGGSFQVRYAHTDLQVPDFSNYRRAEVQDSRADTTESAPARRAFSYVIVGSGGVAGVYAAKSVVSEFVSSMSASADVLALAKIEVKLGDIPEGKNMTFKWRGKPLFIRHRTPTEIETEKSVDLASLRDPQADAERATRPEWLIVLGVCTHLGCVPIANAGDFGGYYCPCHGSHYDASGRIRKGPAPLNLEVPTHSFVDDTTLVVG